MEKFYDTHFGSLTQVTKLAKVVLNTVGIRSPVRNTIGHFDGTSSNGADECLLMGMMPGKRRMFSLCPKLPLVGTVGTRTLWLMSSRTVTRSTYSE